MPKEVEFIEGTTRHGYPTVVAKIRKKSPKRKLTTAKAHLLQSQTPHASPRKSPRNAGRPRPHMPYNVGSGTEGTWDGFSEKKKSKGKVSNHRHLNPCQSHSVIWQRFADTE